MLKRNKRLKRRAWRHRNHRSSRPGHAAPSQYSVEELEPRLLLTTLFGSETFEFRAAGPPAPNTNGPAIRVALGGDVVAEFIATDINASNNLVFGDIPGFILESDLGRENTEILGGFGGADGVEPIGPTIITDSADPLGNIDDPDIIHIEAIASREALLGGQTFGFNRSDVDIAPGVTRTFVQLLELDNVTGAASVAATLHQASLGPDVMASLSGDPMYGPINAFAVDPTTGLGYAVDLTSNLYEINRFTGEVTQIGNLAPDNVNSMAINSTGQMFILSNTQVIEVDKMTAGNINVRPLNPAPGPLPALSPIFARYHGLAFNAADQMFALFRSHEDLESEGSPLITALHEITPGTGSVVEYGLIQTGDGAAGGTDTIVEGISFGRDSRDIEILVGLDQTDIDTDTNQILPKLINISTIPIAGDQVSVVAASVLSEAGSISEFRGLGSFNEAGDGRPLLFTASTTRLVRGTPVSLPVEPEAGTSSVETILGADFQPRVGNPFDGRLFFVPKDTPIGLDSPFNELYHLDATATNRSAIQNSLTLSPILFQEEREITTIAFDEYLGNTGSPTVRLLGFDSDSSSLVEMNPMDAEPVDITVVTFFGETVDSISGLTFPFDNPNTTELFGLAVDRAGAESQLLQINTVSGSSFGFGPLSDPDDIAAAEAGEPIRGEDIASLTFNALLDSPFTAGRGVLLGTDRTKGELVAIDGVTGTLNAIGQLGDQNFRPRFPNADTFAIYISQAGPNASISISEVMDPDTDTDDPRVMLPFEQNTGDLRIVPANGDVFVVSGNPESGAYYLGARTENVFDEIEEEDLIPFLQANVGTRFGVRAAGVDDLPEDNLNNLSAGLVVAETLLDFFRDDRYLLGLDITEPNLGDRLLELNTDVVAELAVSQNGSQILAVDTNNPPPDNGVAGDELIIIDTNPTFDAPITLIESPNPTFGQAIRSTIITDATTGLTLKGIQGLDFGDVNLDGTTELFAVMDIVDFVPIDDIGGDLSTVVDITEAPAPPAGDLDIRDITINRNLTVFGLDNDGGALRLLQIERNVDGSIGTVTDLGNITTSAGTPVTDIFAIASSPSSGTIHVVGQADGDTELFTVGLATVDTNDPGNAATEVMATPLGTLNDGANVTDTIKALAFILEPGTGEETLYGVRDVAGTDSLIQIALTGTAPDTVDVTTIGNIVGQDTLGLPSIPTNVTAMTFAIQNLVMIGIHDGPMADDNQIVVINLANPSTETTFASEPGRVTDSLVGLATDINDFAYSVSDGGVNPNTILVSPGSVANLGTLDAASAEFTKIDTVGGGLVRRVAGMSFSVHESTNLPGQQALFVVDDQNRLFEIDPTNAAAVAMPGRINLDPLTPNTPFIYLGVNSLDLRRQIDFSGPEETAFGPNLPPPGSEIPIAPIGALAGDDTGRIFGLYNDGFIHEVDPLVDQEVFLSTLAPPAPGIQGMAFDGVNLYAFATSDQMLYTMNPDTGVVLNAVPVGSGISLFGLAAFDADEPLAGPATVWGVEPATAMIHVIDPTTGIIYSSFDAPETLEAGHASIGLSIAEGGSTLIYANSDNAPGTLYRLHPTAGTVLSTESITTDVIDGLAFMSEPIPIESFEINRNGVAFGHDTFNGRLMDITLTNGIAGTNTLTSNGSLRPTVGAMSYDFSNDQFLVIDNSTGLELLDETVEPTSPESSVLMWMLGTESDSPTAQQVDNIMLAGTVTGRVDIEGTVDLFYAGWLLTGNTRGQLVGPPTIPANFSVSGDLRALVTLDSIGTDTDVALDEPTYVTGFAMDIGGKLGHVGTQEGLIAGLINVENTALGPDYDGSTLPVVEFEARIESDYDETTQEGIQFQEFDLFKLEGEFYNDSFETAQRVPTVRSSTIGFPDTVLVSGISEQFDLSDDGPDNYAVALLAGQTVTLSVMTEFVAAIVLDPDGRDIGTAVSSLPLRFTADRPGEYRIAVAGPEDWDTPYLFAIEDVGDIALGGIYVLENYMQLPGDTPIFVPRGDIGGIAVNGFVFTDDSSQRLTAVTGNLRSIEAGTIGRPDEEADPIRLDIPRGNVGLLRSTTGGAFLNGLQTSVAIGNDYQLVDVAQTLRGDLIANGGIGVIRAGNIGILPEFAEATITVDADLAGSDGIIDLIDISGSLAAVPITTGPGGNIRYIRVGGQVTKDPFFGSPLQPETEHAPGESVTIRDDSGGFITLTPTGEEAALTLTTYPIRNTGGNVIVNVTSSDSLFVSTRTFQNQSPVEISQINVNGSGTPVTVDADGQLVFEPEPDTLGLKVTVEGDGPVDVFDIVGGNFDTIANRTQGEIVNIEADTIGILTGFGNIGVAKQHTGAAVNSLDLLTGDDSITDVARRLQVTGFDPLDEDPAEFDADGGVLARSVAYPFRQLRIGVVADSIFRARSKQAVGNFLLSGFVGELTANSDGRDFDAEAGEFVFEGIAAPVRALGGFGKVQIGEGIAPSRGEGLFLKSSFGGEFARGGIFAGGPLLDTGAINPNIGTVTFPTSSADPSIPAQVTSAIADIGLIVNQGLGSDIAGAIAFTGELGEIRLRDGAIIDTSILGSLELADVIGGILDDERMLSGEIGVISVTGQGGIIGTQVGAEHIANTVVRSGFGIFNSSFAVPGADSMGNFTADGFGIRNVAFRTGASMGNIDATGRGEPLNALSYTPSVRRSQDFEFDPHSHVNITTTNDLHLVMGTSLATPLDMSGLIVAMEAEGGRDLGTVSAYQITPDNASGGGLGGDSNIDFANSIRGISTDDSVDGLEVTTGSLQFFKPGSDVSNLDMKVAGQIKDVRIRGDLLDNSSIFAQGPNGDIRKFRVDGTMDGDIHAEGRVGTIDVREDLSGSVTIMATNEGREALKKMLLGGSLTSGTMNIRGSVGTINAADSLGDPTMPREKLTIHGDVKSLLVGTSRGINGSTLDLDLTVLGTVSRFDVTGMVTGKVTVEKDVKKYNVRSDIATAGGNIFTGATQIFGSARNVTFTGGHVAADFVVGDELKKFQITDGDLASEAAVSSSFGDIGTLNIKGGDLIGSVLANNGQIKTIKVTGSDIGGGIGTILFLANSGDGDTVTVGDGETTVTFEFDDGMGGGVMPDSTSVMIGATPEDSADNLEVAINASPLILTVVENPTEAKQLNLTNTLTPSTVPITTTSSNLSVAGAEPSVISAQSISTLKVDGTLKTGSTISINRDVRQFDIGKKAGAADALETGATVTIGSAQKFTLGSHMQGTLTLGQHAKSTTVKIKGDLGGTTNVDGNATISVDGNVLAGSTISARRDLDKLDVKQTVSGDVFVDGRGGDFKFAALTGAVVTTGFGLDHLTVTGTIDTSLVQAGIRRGTDGVFATTEAAKDADEFSGMADIGTVSTNAVTDSILATTGTWDRFDVKTTMTGSSASSGFSFGSAAIRGVINDATPLATELERITARSGVDRALMRGDFNRITVSGSTMIGSSISAGVDPVDGVFGNADDAVIVAHTNRVLPDGGGNSHIRSVSGSLDGASVIVSDNGILNNETIGGTVVTDVTYAVADITANNPLETLVGTPATPGAPAVFAAANGNTVTIDVSSQGSVAMYDEAGVDTDNVIDTLVIRGPGVRTVAITTSTPGTVDIGRIITEDDTIVQRINFDGALVGDGTDDLDLLIDGTVNEFRFAEVADDANGIFGGDVTALTLSTLGSNRLRIQGTASRITVDQTPAGSGLVTSLGPTPTMAISAMATDATGNTFVFDEITSQITQVNPNTGGVLAGPFNVTNVLDGGAVSLDAMDFGAANVLFGMADVTSLNPSMSIGAMGVADGNLTLRGLTGLRDGSIAAIDFADLGDPDQIVDINPSTGAARVLGSLRDVFDHVYEQNTLQIAADDTFDFIDLNGHVLALVNDRDGTGTAFTTADGAALAFVDLDNVTNNEILLTASRTNLTGLPILLDDGGGPLVVDNVNFTFTAMAIRSDGAVFAILRDIGGGTDELLQITTTGIVIRLGNVTVGDNTSLNGMGFVIDDALNEYLIGQSTGELVLINTVDPSSSTLITRADVVNPDVDAFTIGRGVTATALAYDFDDVESGAFFNSPGTGPTLLTIDLTTPGQEGTATEVQPLAEAADGTRLSAPASFIAVDNFNTGDLFVGTNDSRLLRYDPTDGSLVATIGTLAETDSGRTIPLTLADFDDLTGTFFGGDTQLSRLVLIDPATAEVAERTEPGAVKADMAAFAFDSFNRNFQFNPAGDSTLRVLDGMSNTFVAFNDTTNAALISLEAGSVTNLNLTGGGTLGGRFVSTGNSFNTVRIAGDFSGTISTPGTVTNYTQTGGDFTGALLADALIRSASFSNGNVDVGAVLRTLTLNKVNVLAGNLSGTVLVTDAETIEVSGDGEKTATIHVIDDAGQVSFGGTFGGTLDLGSVTDHLSVDGALEATADVMIRRDAENITLGSTAAGSLVTVSETLNNATVSGTHSGVLASRLGMDRSSFGAVTEGLVATGRDAGSLTVTGMTDGGVFVSGVWVGDDRQFNTDDDLLTGGSFGAANFMGVFQDTAVAAGVLPDLDTTSTNPQNRPDDNGAFGSGFAEVGAMLQSNVERLTIRGNINSTSSASGRFSTVVAGHNINSLNAGIRSASLTQVEFGDPLGPPTVVGVPVIVSQSEVQVRFSEEIGESSLILAIDGDDNGSLNDPPDVPGSIILTGPSGEILDDATILYDSQVLRILRTAGFTESFTLTLKGPIVDLDGFGDDPAVYDASGLRSALRDFNQDGTEDLQEDRLGTILDGDANETEGGDYNVLVTVDDVANDFTEVMRDGPLIIGVDSGVFNLTIGSQFDEDDDIDIYRFTTDDNTRYLSYEVTANEAVQAALFLEDHQGNGLADDDTHEILATHESKGSGPGTIYQAFELPEQGNYFLVVATNGFSPTQDNTYTIDIDVAESDRALVNAAPLPKDPDRDLQNERIAYISNEVDDNHNELGANEPKQLVYLNFDGGTSTLFNANIEFDPFDAAILDSAFNSTLTDVLIEGGNGVTGIVQNVMNVFTSLTHPLGVLNVQRLDGDLTGFFDATDGLFFTTVDPTNQLDPAEGSPVQFTTLFIGEGQDFLFAGQGGLYGIADEDDFANLNKVNEGLVFAQNFQFISFDTNITMKLNEFSLAIANVTAHELGHGLGIIHNDLYLVIDDPNNDGDDSDSLAWPSVSVMARGEIATRADLIVPNFLGTASIFSGEFPIGSIDNPDLLIRWLK